MKQFKGTKKEWVQGATFFSEEEEQPVYWVDIRAGGYKLAQINGTHYGIPNDECVANAKLILAAPYLLKALHLVKKAFDNKLIDSTPGNDFNIGGLLYTIDQSINKAL
jgi:hypothetical protein